MCAEGLFEPEFDLHSNLSLGYGYEKKTVLVIFFNQLAVL